MPLMRAIATPSYGSLEQLALTELPVPEPKAGEVRIRVVASAANPADYKVPTGEVKFLHGRNFPMVVGYDVSGTVDAVGAGVARFKAGDEVFGFLRYGGSTKLGAFAEYTTAPADTLALKPQGVSHTAAASAATAALTAIQAMRDLGKLSGGRVLIIGAAGGVGSLAVGVAQKLGAQVTAVCSTPAIDFVKQLGAAEVIDRRQGDPLQQAKGPFEVVFDAAAAHRWSQAKHLLKPGGTYVTTLPSAAFFVDKLASLVSASRADFLLVKPVPADLELLGQWLTQGLQVPIASTEKVKDVKAAILRMKAGDLRGKIAIDVANGFA